MINGDVAEIVFKNPQLADTGKWALELSNSGGSAIAPFELFVKDKPKVRFLPISQAPFIFDYHCYYKI